MTVRVCVGAIIGAFGVRGEVRVKSFTAVPTSIGDYGPLSTEDGSRHFTLTITRPVKNGFAVRLSGVATREQAAGLRGTRLYAPREALPGLPNDEFYYADLIGLAVVDTGGQDRGQVHAVHNHGASDLLEVRANRQRSAVLVPFTQEIVPMVDLAAGRIIIDPPDGLFDDATDAGQGA
ncbi:MAG: 16S rRNA processing protein RimM [Rhodobacteraceae bacterium]|nr:16S rRNA processing protein RimM [Paracoccaceae bacterium]